MQDWKKTFNREIGHRYVRSKDDKRQTILITVVFLLLNFSISFRSQDEVTRTCVVDFRASGPSFYVCKHIAAIYTCHVGIARASAHYRSVLFVSL
jgi:hypothetical protein